MKTLRVFKSHEIGKEYGPKIIIEKELTGKTPNKISIQIEKPDLYNLNKRPVNTHYIKFLLE